MADVFISYERADRVWAERIGEGLRAVGLSCWWDTSVASGEYFNPEVERQLKDCRCVVVIWSEGAYASRWVQAEAIYAYQAGRLVATRLDDVALGYPFSVVQTVDLRNGGVDEVVEGVQLKLGAPVGATRKRRMSTAAALSMVCLLASMALSVFRLLTIVEDEWYSLTALFASWVLGAVGAIALFASISRRSSFAAYFGGGVALAFAFAGSAAYTNTAPDDTIASYALPILSFTPGIALLSALFALLARRWR